MKHTIYTFALIIGLLFIATTGNGQGMAMNITGTAADASAMLDVASTTKGMLVPRMTTAQRTTISLPANGLLVYDVTLSSFYFNSGTSGAPIWTAVGGSTLPAGTNGQQLQLVSGSPTWVTTQATVTTTAVSGISLTTASCGGNVTVTGGATVTARGVCWSTNASPSAALSTKTTDGSGTGSYTSSITGLTPGTTYYVRAYATNSAGTSYGDEIAFTAIPATVGASYQGGIVVYILVPGDLGYSATAAHGLIASTSDQGVSIAWYNGTNTVTGATGTAIGTGSSNTTAIIANQGAGSYAARVCRNYTGGGYTDWYLPSKDELNLLYTNRAAVGGFSIFTYFSSSEISSSNVWAQSFNTGSQSSDVKYGYRNARAVRTF